ncbi:MAG: tetratricopeptide repeat protein, partial [Terriglobia bacterium]
QEVASRFGAKVIRIPWEDDFAKARNASLAEVHSDWVLCLDADELLDESARGLFPSHLRAKHVMVYSVQIRNYVLDPSSHLWDQDARPNNTAPAFAQHFPAYVEHSNLRLFRRHPDLYFEGCVHETVAFRAQRLGAKQGNAGFVIHHLGFARDDQETLANKAIQYRELGRKKMFAMPENAMAHFELGIEEFQRFGNFPEAVGLFKRATELDPRLGVAWYFYGKSLGQLGQHREALQALERAAETDGRKEKVFEAQGDMHYNLGELEEARSRYRQVIDLTGGNPEAGSKLGLAEVRMGQTQEGLNRIRQAVNDAQKSTTIHDRLITACAWLGDLAAAAEAAEDKLRMTDPRPEFFLRAASLRAQTQDWARVAALLQQGLDLFPKNEKLQRADAEASAARNKRVCAG